jgi:hypothetical protein
MDTPKQLSVCFCNLKLGIEQLSNHDVLNSKDLERKYELVNQAIHFHGPCGTQENCTIKEKIYELKDKIAEYYFDPEKKVIAIPNQITLPLQPIHLDSNETDEKRQKRYAIENDKYYEDLLHLAIISNLKELDSDGFVIEGFQSGDCIKAKLELGKQLRKDSQCKCRSNQTCTCGKPRYPELNVHEKDVLDILEVGEISDNELARYQIVLY